MGSGCSLGEGKNWRPRTSSWRRAAGDIRGGPMFTHTSWDDYRVLLSQMAGDGSHTTKRVVPYAIFTDPELGRVGMTEREARDAGHDVEVMRLEMSKDSKAQEIGE